MNFPVQQRTMEQLLEDFAGGGVEQLKLLNLIYSVFRAISEDTDNVTWDDVQNKPSTFPAADIGQVDGPVGPVVDTVRVVYGTDGAGAAATITYGPLAVSSALVSRDASGFFEVNDPLEDAHPVTKSYVDQLVDGLMTDAEFAERFLEPTTFIVYGTNNAGQPANIGYAGSPQPSTLAIRNINGQLRATAAESSDQVVNLSQLDGRLSQAQRNAIDALPTTGATVDDVVAALKAV